MNAKIKYFLFMNIFKYEQTPLRKYDNAKFTLNFPFK